MIYVLNSAILTSHGKYYFFPLSTAGARRRLEKGFVSAVGHEATAEVLSRLLGVKVPVNRARIQMQPGDEAVVFRLHERLPEGKVLSAEELEQHGYDLALLMYYGTVSRRAV